MIRNRTLKRPLALAEHPIPHLRAPAGYSQTVNFRISLFSVLLAKLAEKIQNYLKGRVEFNDGSYVERLHREAIVYLNGSLSMEIGFLFDAGLFIRKRIILSSQISEWDPRNQNKRVSAKEKSEILEKIKKYFEKNRIKTRSSDRNLALSKVVTFSNRSPATPQ